MRSQTARVHMGLALRRGKKPGRGYLLKARNSRYLPGDLERIWSLLGRSTMGVVPGEAQYKVKSVFPYYPDDGSSKLCVHRGGSIYESVLIEAGAFSEAYQIDAGDVKRGRHSAFKERLYYPASSMYVRETTGWRKAGFPEMYRDSRRGGRLASFQGVIQLTATAVNEGSGSLTSSTAVQYLCRVYDENLDMESARSAIVEIPAFTNAEYIEIGIQYWDTSGTPDRWLNGWDPNWPWRGTHVRIYRTALSETPGLFWRVGDGVDGTYGYDEGIPTEDVTFNYRFQDQTSNTDSKIMGFVPADGEEGSLAWAEHGGKIVECFGSLIFRDHLVVWDNPDYPNRCFYSAQGKPEGIPVDWDGNPQYYLSFTSEKQDELVTMALAGTYLLAFGKSGIWRVTHLPTYALPGFERQIQKQYIDTHGICGPHAVTTVGSGEEDNQEAFYCSREFGPMVTNGIAARRILRHINWSLLASKEYYENTVVADYQEYEEVWVFYTPKGGSANTAAIIIDYSAKNELGILRVTGPVDVRAVDAIQANTIAGDPRLFIIDDTNSTVYVQDYGTTDTQKNYNDDGDVLLQYETGRIFAKGTNRVTKCLRAMVSGISGAAVELDVKHYAQDGVDDPITYGKVSIGPGETEDLETIGSTGQSHRTLLEYAGEVGSSYEEDETTCALGFRQIEYELNSAGRQHRTRTGADE